MNRVEARLHPDKNFDFQLTRLAAEVGPALRERLRPIAKRIHTLEDWQRELTLLERESTAAHDDEGIYRFARAAEFFMRPADPERRAAYERFRAAFDRVHGAAYERHAVPYDGDALPALRLAPRGSHRGVVLIHGGFDSFIEEFFGIYAAIRERGFEVIAFDGPGQGEPLIRRGVHMTPDWQRPVSALLDHFGLREVTLVGVSLGGCLALRAAAREPRIARVVAFDVMYDFFDCVTTRKGPVAHLALQRLLPLREGRIVDRLLRLIMRRDSLVRWGMEQGMHVTGADTPSGFLRAAQAYNTRDCSVEVTQDVLVLAGAEDHFVPLRQLDEQLAALTRARSVTSHLFTAQEGGVAHCQIDNLPLAIEVIEKWISSKSDV